MLGHSEVSTCRGVSFSGGSTWQGSTVVICHREERAGEHPLFASHANNIWFYHTCGYSDYSTFPQLDVIMLRKLWTSRLPSVLPLPQPLTLSHILRMAHLTERLKAIGKWSDEECIPLTGVPQVQPAVATKQVRR